MTKLLWMTLDRHPDSLRDLIREQLAATGWDIFEVSYDDIDALQGVPLEQIDAVFLAPARHFPPRYMDRLTRCRLMQIWSSGYDKFNVQDAQFRGIMVANNYGSNAVSVAEHTILMMLGVSRRAPEMHHRVITGSWAGNDHGMTSYSLAGKSLGIVGLGSIGTLVAQRAEALGMKIFFADPGVPERPGRGWERQPFEKLLEISDYVSFHVHLGPETRHMLNSHNVGLLKKRPFIINVSRAELIEKRALIGALEKRTIRGLAIDAHYQEPTEESDALFASDSVFFSPHVAGSTVDSYSAMCDACVQNITNAISDQEIRGLIGLSEPTE